MHRIAPLGRLAGAPCRQLDFLQQAGVGEVAQGLLGRLRNDMRHGRVEAGRVGAQDRVSLQRGTQHVAIEAVAVQRPGLAEHVVADFDHVAQGTVLGLRVLEFLDAFERFRQRIERALNRAFVFVAQAQHVAEQHQCDRQPIDPFDQLAQPGRIGRRGVR